MRHQALRNRILAVMAQLRPQGTTIRIEGGLPPDYAPPAAKPPGGDLQVQAKLFSKGAVVSGKPAHAKIAPEGAHTPSEAPKQSLPNG